MITDPQIKIFSILKNTSQNLVLKKGQTKLIYKTYRIKSPQALKMLERRCELNHPNIIKLCQIQLAGQTCGLAFQHYTQSLSNCIFNYQKYQNDQEVINTFEPILQVLDYIIKSFGFISSQFSLQNVVFNQNLEVKYIDDLFLRNQICISQQIKNPFKVYQKVAFAIYSLLFPKENQKTWKNRLKIAKQKTSRQLYNFLASVFTKSLSNSIKNQNSQNQINLNDPLYPQKLKKIKKTKQKNRNNYQQESSNSKQYLKKCKNKNPCSNRKSQKYFTGCQCHQGKQNKLYQ